MLGVGVGWHRCGCWVGWVWVLGVGVGWVGGTTGLSDTTNSRCWVAELRERTHQCTRNKHNKWFFFPLSAPEKK